MMRGDTVTFNNREASVLLLPKSGEPGPDTEAAPTTLTQQLCSSLASGAESIRPYLPGSQIFLDSDLSRTLTTVTLEICLAKIQDGKGNTLAVESGIAIMRGISLISTLQLTAEMLFNVFYTNKTLFNQYKTRINIFVMISIASALGINITNHGFSYLMLAFQQFSEGYIHYILKKNAEDLFKAGLEFAVSLLLGLTALVDSKAFNDNLFMATLLLGVINLFLLSWEKNEKGWPSLLQEIGVYGFILALSCLNTVYGIKLSSDEDHLFYLELLSIMIAGFIGSYGLKLEEKATPTQQDASTQSPQDLVDEDPEKQKVGGLLPFPKSPHQKAS